jgi:hypothetical protein|tara:strand:- start:79 stop:318 length:240 start_codon:yes stop_codon:yes gene_type:complete
MSENEEKVTAVDLHSHIFETLKVIIECMATTTRQTKDLHDRVRELENEILVMRSEKIALETVSTLLHKTTPDDVDSTRD